MATDTDTRLGSGGSMVSRLTRLRIVLAAATLVFGGLIALGLVAPIPGIAGLALILLAALIGGSREAGSGAIAPSRGEATSLTHGPLLAAAISGIPDPVIVVDRQANVVVFNAKAQAIVSTLAQQQPLSFALRVPDIHEAVRPVATSGRSERVEFFERVPADRWSEAFIVPIAMPAGTGGELIVVTLHDLTPIRHVENMRADFVANASHELRTPLASLSGFIETLQGRARDDPQAREKFLGIMKQQANRMARLIDDLLSLSRIELRAHVQPQTTVDLAAIVRQVADGLQMLARDRGVEITLAMPATPLTVRGDRDELIRLFENLIENGLKYGAAGKRVDVTGAREQTSDGAEALIAVRDFGPGIAPEHLPRLTERFYRVDVAESRAQGGTGLGLALVKHILNRHRGRLTIDSVPGQGATFAVRIPATQDDNSAIKSKS
jgi:two-component system, OmpR family, phosphate regulon sensor histidine kinase PhoR